MEDLGAFCSITSGSMMLQLGSFNHSQNKRSHESLSKDALSETASADKVDLATLGIFFKDQAIGHTTPTWLQAKRPSVVKIIVPCRDEVSLFVVKEASLSPF